MLPFHLKIKPGQTIFQQIVYAIKTAVAKGQLKEGDRVPSVRDISQELGVNPNTVQKAIAELKNQGIVEIHAGRLGCRIAPQAMTPKEDKMKLIEGMVENLIVESSKWDFTHEELREAIDHKWRELKQEEGHKEV